MVFPVVIYGCESWTIKKAEHWRTDAFKLWCWRRLLSILWTARRSNQSVLKCISPEYSLEGLMLKLKLQYFGHMMCRTDSLGKILMLGKFEGRRRSRQQRMRWLDGISNSMDMSLSKFPVLVMEREACHPCGHKELSMTETLNWTELAWTIPLVSLIFLKRSLVFPILLFSSISLHWSLKKVLLSLLVFLWRSAFRWVYLSFSPLPLASLLFPAVCKSSSDNHFCLFAFLFLGGFLDLVANTLWSQWKGPRFSPWSGN